VSTSPFSIFALFEAVAGQAHSPGSGAALPAMGRGPPILSGPPL